MDGLPAALQAAGITGVKIFGAVPDSQGIQGLRDKTEAWWVTLDSTLGVWLQMDAILRIQEAGGAAANVHLSENGNPLGVLTPDNIGSTGNGVPVYPTNYADLFKKLWRRGD